MKKLFSIIPLVFPNLFILKIIKMLGANSASPSTLKIV